MRLLIYLLAMLTGFSAADAARPVSGTPATQGSAIEQAIAVAVAVERSGQQQSHIPALTVPSLSAAAGAPAQPLFVLAAASPVALQDMKHQ